MDAEVKRVRPQPVLEETNAAKTADVYGELNYGAGLAGWFLRHSHKVCEATFGPNDKFSQVLEVGAGGGHHINFVRHQFDRYVMTDLNADYLRHLVRTTPQGRGGAVEVEAQDATRLDYADSSFDRVIATHVLEHLPEPHRVLLEWARVLKPGGVLSLVLPCDPGIAWRTGRSLGPRAAAKKQGIEYDYWMAREHINPIGNLIEFVRFHFPERKEIWSPLPVPLTDINLFFVCHLRV
jgi:SAM-dependent methyltransferase